MDKENELLVILMEECAEVIKEASKLIRFGGDYKKLELEVGDVMCMFQLLEEQGKIDWPLVSLTAQSKRNKLKTWSNLDV